MMKSQGCKCECEHESNMGTEQQQPCGCGGAETQTGDIYHADTLEDWLRDIVDDYDPSRLDGRTNEKLDEMKAWVKGGQNGAVICERCRYLVDLGGYWCRGCPMAWRSFRDYGSGDGDRVQFYRTPEFGRGAGK